MRQTTPRTSVHILVVEDNIGDIRLLQEAFKECCFEAKLSVARNGDDAMAFLRREPPFEKSPRPELILLDLKLPRKDGREVLAEIKGEPGLRQIPVMILSTSTRIEDINSAYDLNANSYISKPTDIGGLIAMTKAIESFWLKTAILAGGLSVPVRPVQSARLPPMSAVRKIS